MNKIYKQYLKEVKLLFPILGKEERQYLSSVALDLEEYCLDENISTIEMLYDMYGVPMNVVTNYFSTWESSRIIQEIKLRKRIQQCIVVLIMFSTICALYLGIYEYTKLHELEKSTPYSIETMIED